jgi:hypothetical protein
LKGKTKYWWGLIGALVIGGLLALSPAPHWVVMLFCLSPPRQLEDLLQKSGDALFIAGLLAILVDTALKEKLLSEFAHDVSIHIIGEWLPLGLRDHLRHYLEIKFVRTQWTITFVIEPHPNTNYVLLRISSAYSVENCARKELPYPFRVKVEQSWYSQFENSIESLDYGDGLIEKSEFMLHRDHYNHDDHGNVVYARDIRIPPRAHGDKPRDFRANMIQHYWEHSFCIFYATSLVVTTTVIVKSPAGQFEVDLDLTFDGNVPKPRRGDALGSEERTWVLEEPILPGQGFFVRWKPV